MRLGKIFAISLLIALIIGVSITVATIFAIPFLLFLGFFIAAFARPSKYDLYKMRAGLGLSEDQEILLIALIPLITYGLLATLGIGIVTPQDRVINPHTIDIELANTSFSISEQMTFHLSQDDLTTEIGRYLPSYAKVIDITCPPNMSPFTYNLTDKGLERVGCRKISGMVSDGEYPMFIKYTLPTSFTCNNGTCMDMLSLGNCELDTTNLKIISETTSIIPTIGNYLSSGDVITVKVVVPETQIITGIYSSEHVLSKTREEIENHVIFAGFLIVTTSIILVLLTYLLMGRERRYNVPRYITSIPSKVKPYLVNLLFYGAPDKIEDGGIIATIIDLGRRGYLNITEDRITFNKRKSADNLDKYEGKVYWTLRRLAEETGNKNSLKLGILQNKIATTGDITWLKFVKELIEDLYVVENRVSAYNKMGRYVALGIYALTGIAGLLITVKWSHINYLWLGYSVLASATSVLFAIYAFDLYALGKYTPKFAKEREKWDAFRNTLNEYALIRESIKDKNELLEWLVYSTALESSDEIKKVVFEMGGNKTKELAKSTLVLSPSLLLDIIKSRIEELRR